MGDCTYCTSHWTLPVQECLTWCQWVSQPCNQICTVQACKLRSSSNFHIEVCPSRSWSCSKIHHPSLTWKFSAASAALVANNVPSVTFFLSSGERPFKPYLSLYASQRHWASLPPPGRCEAAAGRWQQDTVVAPKAPLHLLSEILTEEVMLFIKFFVHVGTISS